MRRHVLSVTRSTTVQFALPLALLVSAACGMNEPGPDEQLLLHPGGDVLAAGEDLVLTDSVPGDAMAAGGEIRFEGFVGGSYVGAGGTQVVAGRIDGSIRAAGANVRVEASVGRNVTLAGGNIELAATAAIERNAYLAGGDVRVAGTVGGDAYAGAGVVEIEGEIGGDVRVEAGRLVIGPGARIGGDLRYRTDEGQAVIDPSATIAGDVQALPPREEPGARPGLVFFVLRLVAFLVAGVLLVALFPRGALILADSLRSKPGAALGIGLVVLVAFPIAIGVAAMTLVGIPAALVLAAVFGIFLYLAPVVPAVWLGSELLGGMRGRDRWTQIKRFLAGGLVLAFAILLPWVGWPVRVLAVCIGLGTLVLTLTRSGEGTAPASV